MDSLLIHKMRGFKFLQWFTVTELTVTGVTPSISNSHSPPHE